jgi:hypothetical protein
MRRGLFAVLNALLALSLAPQVAAQTEVAATTVALPPFMVEDSHEQFRFYVRTPRFEVLSSCSRLLTQEFADHYLQMQHALGSLVPEEYLLSTSAPEAIILVDERNNRVATELTSQLLAEETRRLARQPGEDDRVAVTQRFLPNLRVWDGNSDMSFVVIRELEFAPEQLTISEESFRFRLENRAPTLPRWFVDGMAVLFRQSDVNAKGVTIRPFTWVSADITRQLREREPPSDTVAQLLATLADAKASPLPFEQFFSESADGRIREVRSYQAALLLYLGLHPDWHDKLWRLVAKSTEHPITGADFEECTGVTFEHMTEITMKYLNALMKTPAAHRVPVRLPRPPQAPDVREATEAEIARIRGDWACRLVRYVRAHEPGYTGFYVARAQRTLAQVEARGAMTPELAAAAGSLDLLIGNTYAARPLLETATSAHVAQPRPYFDLAYMLVDAAGARKLASAETADLVALLSSARRFAPAFADLYRLYAAIGLRTAAHWSQSDLEPLADGMRLFPRDFELRYQAVSAYAQHGLADAALALIEKSPSPPPELQSRFEQLAKHLKEARGRK